ncbi:MAG TPA: PspC domain-containing protein [Herpetosiphonaceae bacterium]
MYNSPQRSNSLYRPDDQRILAGVCAGLGRYFGMDATIVRVLWVVGSLFFGSGVVAYLLAWLIMPDAGGRRAATPLVLLLVFFVAIPLMCFLLTLPFRIFF